LKRIKYVINDSHNIDEFETLYFNGWNLYSLCHYVNLLIGETRKKINILIDGNVINNWREPIENDDGIKCIYGTVTNEGLEDSPDCMIASVKDLVIKRIMVNGRSLMKAVYAWSKITTRYALSI
jgi:hypothetical protein